MHSFSSMNGRGAYLLLVASTNINNQVTIIMSSPLLLWAHPLNFVKTHTFLLCYRMLFCQLRFQLWVIELSCSATDGTLCDYILNILAIYSSIWVPHRDFKAKRREMNTAPPLPPHPFHCFSNILPTVTSDCTIWPMFTLLLELNLSRGPLASGEQLTYKTHIWDHG